MAKEKQRKKGYDYFEYFCASARYACQAAEHLEKSLANFAPEAKQFASLITKCCHALLATIEEFRHFKKSQTIGKHIIEVNTLESDGDTLHAECIRKLFCGSEDALSIIAWMTLFEGFEECLDACEDAVDVIESVIMKNT